MDKDISPNTALKFVVLIGIVSLFADMTYEAARSITGPYLALLGANAALVGFVSGLGEFLGYGLRIVSGYLADYTKRYWTITIVGYTCNLLVIPFLALTSQWWMAAILIVAERMGKAIRVPPRDAMLSHAGQKAGMGWAFGLHEALDQAGAMIGPLIVALVLYYKGTYQECFALLLIPALLAIAALLLAFIRYPNPHSLEIKNNAIEPRGMNRSYWVYLFGASLVAAGYADFPLMAYHFQKTALLTPAWIPVFYSIAMGANVFLAPLLGYLYDKKGFIILIIVTFISSFFAPLAFLGGFNLALFGVILWSIGVSAHQSLMRAIIAHMTSKEQRGAAYGVFNTGFGLFWFLGSLLMGILYDVSIPSLVAFSLITQLLAVPVLYCSYKQA